MPAELFDEYDVTREVGRGAASVVYQVCQPRAVQLYALKVVRPTCRADRRLIDQVRNEYAIGKQLDHPSLVKVYQLREQRRLFRVTKAALLMEWFNGLPMEGMSRLPLDRLVGTFYQVAAALTYMHAQGFLHGDIKPKNLLYDANGQVKIIDFGLSRRRGAAARRVQGTLEYMAPEQASSGVMTDRTDIYNFGATMYRLLTDRPFPSRVDRGALEKTYVPMRGRLEPPSTYRPGIPPKLDELVVSCCERVPQNRPELMAAVLAEIVGVANQMGLDLSTFGKL